MKKNGFSLIETILYIGAIIVLVPTVVGLLPLFVRFQSRVQQISEIEQQGDRAMKIITQTIRGADRINSPVIGASSSTLSLDVFATSSDPTVITSSVNTNSTTVMTMSEGSSSTIQLTNEIINLSNLIFSNTSRPVTTGTIKVEFAL